MGQQIKETSVFKSGNSQAVRIPKEFHIDEGRVDITRDGDRLIITPRAPKSLSELMDGWDNIEDDFDLGRDTLVAAPDVNL